MSSPMIPENKAGAGPQALIRRMGPAWIISAVACGPATLASVSLAGSRFGYRLLWVVILSALLAFVAQYLAARVGLLSGQGIISLVERSLGRTWAWLLTLDALAATWLAAAILMKALTEVTGLITGLASPWWSLSYGAAIFLLVGMGGYKPLEAVSKGLVVLVVLCFVITLTIARPEADGVLRGLVPTLPGGLDGAMMSAGIMGGAVHVTILAMHAYNLKSRGWTEREINLAWWDTFLSMFLAFGLYSTSVFLVSAAVLHPQGLDGGQPLVLARSLTPLLGPWAGAVFLAGLWGAALSTITPTFLAAGFFAADKLGWELSVRDRRFRLVVLAGILLSLVGPHLEGGFVPLLVVMLALGLCGTPLILVILLILGNRKAVVGQNRNPVILNLMGLAALGVTSFLALRFVLSRLGP